MKPTLILAASYMALWTEGPHVFVKYIGGREREIGGGDEAEIFSIKQTFIWKRTFSDA